MPVEWTEARRSALRAGLAQGWRWRDQHEPRKIGKELIMMNYHDSPLPYYFTLVDVYDHIGSFHLRIMKPVHVFDYLRHDRGMPILSSHIVISDGIAGRMFHYSNAECWYADSDTPLSGVHDNGLESLRSNV